MDFRNRPVHNRSSSLSGPYAPAPRPSFVPFSVVESPLWDLENQDVRLSPQRELVLLRSFIQNTLSKDPQSSLPLVDPPSPHFPSKPTHEPPDDPPFPHSVPASLNQSLSHKSPSSYLLSHNSLHLELNALKIEKQEKGVERILWKKLVNQLIAISIPKQYSEQAELLCAELETDLQEAKPASELLVKFQEKVIQLYGRGRGEGGFEEQEDWKTKCEFYVGLLEQQNKQIEELRTAAERASPMSESEKDTLIHQVQTLEEELRRIRTVQQEHEEALDVKLKGLEEGRKLAYREKNAIQEAYQRQTASLQEASIEKAGMNEEIANLRSKMTMDATEKIKLMEELDLCKRTLETARVKIAELEQELTNAASPYSHLHSIGEQLGAKFTTVSDLFAYLTTNLQASDPDQQCLLEAYRSLNQRLSGPISASPAPSFIAAMLSFLLIRKKMIEEERELHGHTLLGLKTQLVAANAELDLKNKAYMQVALELNELKLTSKAQQLDAELYKKRSESAEEELKVLKKAHERHIDLYKTELDAVEKRMNTAEKMALEKGVQAEALRKANEELELKLTTSQEENEALEHENSFLAYEREELQKNLVYSKLLKIPGNSSLRELNATLSEIQQALRDQQTQKEELEGVIASLHFQLEEAQSQHSKLSEELCMFSEDMRVRESERLSNLRLRGQIEIIRNEKEKLNRNLREIAQRMATVTSENEELVKMLESKDAGSNFADIGSRLNEKRKIEAKYNKLKQLYRRLEVVNKRVLRPSDPRSQLVSGNTSISELDQKEGRLEDIERRYIATDPNWWDQSLDKMSEVIRMDESVESLGNSILVDMQGLESMVKGTVMFDGIKWTLIFNPEIGYYWVQEGDKTANVSRMVGVYKEIEALLIPYVGEFEDITLAFSRILQEYEQMRRVKSASGSSTHQDLAVVSPRSRPPARMGNYSDEEDEVQALLLEFARSVSKL